MTTRRHSTTTLIRALATLAAMLCALGLRGRLLGGESAPLRVLAHPGDRSVVLHWTLPASPTALGYEVGRAASPGNHGVQLTRKPIGSAGFVDLAVSNGCAYTYSVKAVNQRGDAVATGTVTAIPRAFLDDGDFLDLLQQTAFDYFWNEANPTNGLIRDRSRPDSFCSIAAVGFGLTAIGIGIDHGWVSRAEGRERTLATLRTFWQGPQGFAPQQVMGYRGWFYHFLDLNTGWRSGRCELSSIDTALLLAGIIYAREFFDGPEPLEVEIRGLADQILQRVDWHWMSNGGGTLTMGWTPESGFIPSRWVGYSEAMILYLLGLGVPTTPLPPVHWAHWTKGYHWESHEGYSFINFPPLFGHQYSHCWIDFRGLADDYTRDHGITYFENSRRATLAQRAYAIANPKHWQNYGAELWGFSASDGPDGYSARGAPPGMNDDGTICPTAVGGSLAFTPHESLVALRRMYAEYRTRIWTRYGFCDAFNVTRDWWDTDVLGIDQGPILIMAENYRTQRVWNRFMRNAVIRRGLERAGFRPVAARP